MNSTKRIFRFKFSEIVNKELYDFTEKNQYFDPKTLKENWETYINTKPSYIESEISRLKGIGFTGDSIKKMWTSVRYYHYKNILKERIKIKNPEETTVKKQSENITRKYVQIDVNFLNTIDEHIRVQMKHTNFKPSKSRNDFIEKNTDEIDTIYTYLVRNGFTKDDAVKKLVKTYNNRYFNLTINSQ